MILVVNQWYLPLLQHSSSVADSSQLIYEGSRWIEILALSRPLSKAALDFYLSKPGDFMQNIKAGFVKYLAILMHNIFKIYFVLIIIWYYLMNE